MTAVVEPSQVPDGWGVDQEPASERRVPHDAHAEQAVLGALIVSRGNAVADVEPILTGRDFHKPAHGVIWETILRLWGRGAPIDGVVVADDLDQRGELTRAGGRAYLHTLVEATPSPTSAAYYATIVRARAVERRLVEAGQRTVAIAYGPGDAESKVAAAQAEVERVAAGTGSGGAVNLGQRVDVIYERYENPRTGDDAGLTWGWIDADGSRSKNRDGLLRPMTPGQLIVIGARPGAGKSTLVRNIAAHVACTLRKRVMLHALEQSTEETEDCIVSAIAGVSHKRLLDGTLEERDWVRLAKARDHLDDADLIVDDTPDLTLPGMLASARRHKPDLLIVDQLQLMHMPPGRDRQEGVSEITRSSKNAAKTLGIPIILVSKMNRGPEQRTDKKPVMSDLRESGNIESDADVIILLHREDQYDQETPRAGEADLIVAKQRRGAQGVVVLANQLHYQRFVSLAGD